MLNRWVRSALASILREDLSQSDVDKIEDLVLKLQLSSDATHVTVIEDADHGLSPVKRSNRTPEDVTGEVLASIDTYLQRTIGG